MKRIIALLLAMLMVSAMVAGCSDDVIKDPTPVPDATNPTSNATEPPETDPTETEGSGDVTEPELEVSEVEKVLNAIMEEQPMQFPTLVMPVDLTDEFAVESYTGLKSTENVVEAAFCEAAMGSQAFSLVLVRVNDAANAEAVAKAMQEGINPRKWICVEADDLMVVATGDLVLLAMMDSEYAADATAQSTVDVFVKNCGELSVTLTGK